MIRIDKWEVRGFEADARRFLVRTFEGIPVQDGGQGPRWINRPYDEFASKPTYLDETDASLQLFRAGMSEAEIKRMLEIAKRGKIATVVHGSDKIEESAR